MNLKHNLKKTWDFLWKSNSIWSWIIDLILVFLIVKFIFFPLFALIFATPLPFVIVESDSMHHEGTFDDWHEEFGDWYESRGMTKQEILTWDFVNGLDKGDIVVVFGKEPNQYELGDIIIFQTVAQKTPIIHRVVEVDERGQEFVFSTKGDNNERQLSYLGLNIEKDIREENVLGKAVFRVPYLGWIKLVFVESLNSIF
jgi:hypothetical protein